MVRNQCWQNLKLFYLIDIKTEKDILGHSYKYISGQFLFPQLQWNLK